jgi:hypothetical protein
MIRHSERDPNTVDIGYFQRLVSKAICFGIQSASWAARASGDTVRTSLPTRSL